MCRFILLKSSKLIKPDRIVNSFADMAKKSKAFDGDWQGDGWGLSWLENSDWKSYKSIKPIWEDRQYLINFPQTKYFLIHARSSSFPKHKNNKNYNQPFNNKKYSYVFNGLLKGVTLSSPGEIGSQKIWNLLKNNLNDTDPKEALNKVNSILFNKSRQIQALNIGLCDQNNIYALCSYSAHPDYYGLHFVESKDINIICSEPLRGYCFQSIASNTVITL